jgi:rubrerythrin
MKYAETFKPITAAPTEDTVMPEPKLTDVLDTAIQREREAYHFYTDLKGRVEDDSARQALAFIAGEELKHEAFLLDYKGGKLGDGALQMREAIHYKIAEYLDEPAVSDNMLSQEVFLVAAHRESRSNQFYAELAALHEDPDLKDMLLKMANEELKHKEKMEYLYANAAFPQTDGG